MFQKKFAYFVSKIEKMNLLFEDNFVSIEEAKGRLLSKCGKCLRIMKYIPSKPCRLFCQKCDQSYSLPQNGTIKAHNGAKCPFDGFELVIFSAGADGKTFPLCPCCFNNPPFENFKKGMSCSQCIHPTCKNSLTALKVMDCPECDGSLVFDPTSGPKWKMCCNKCNYLVHFVEKAHSIISFLLFLYT